MAQKGHLLWRFKTLEYLWTYTDARRRIFLYAFYSFKRFSNLTDVMLEHKPSIEHVDPEEYFL